jgi:hypothetical protein
MAQKSTDEEWRPLVIEQAVNPSLYDSRKTNVEM